jgi:hypothetical protein
MKFGPIRNRGIEIEIPPSPRGHHFECTPRNESAERKSCVPDFSPAPPRRSPSPAPWSSVSPPAARTTTLSPPRPPRRPYVESAIEHDGSGISLTDGKTKVQLTNFLVDAGTSMLTGDVSANGKSVVKGAPLFFLDGRTLEPLQVNENRNEAVLFGTTVSLTKAAADLLNQTYGTDALTEFFKVGVARITLKLS